jgi:trigger factor
VTSTSPSFNVIRHTARSQRNADIDAMIENLRMQRRSLERSRARCLPAGDAVRDRDLVAGWRRPPCRPTGVERGAHDHRFRPSMLRRSSRPWVGMKAGEEKLVEIEFPADWRVPQFAGRKRPGAP